MSQAIDPLPSDTPKSQVLRCAKLGAKVGFWVMLLIMVIAILVMIGMAIVASFRTQISFWDAIKKAGGGNPLLLIAAMALQLAIITIVCGILGGLLGWLFGLLGRRKPTNNKDESPWDQE